MFIKIHLMSHFTDTVRLFGSLEQFSTEVGETLHKLPKEAFRACNKDNPIPQVLHYCTRRYVIRMRELNLVQLAKDGFWQTEIQDVMHLYASKEDRREASKLGREGKGSLAAFRLRKNKGQDSDESAGEDADDEDEDDEGPKVDEEVYKMAEERAIRLPPLIPLFSESVKEDPHSHPLFSKPLDVEHGTRYFSGKVAGKKLTLNGLGNLFDAPHIARKVRENLIERHQEYSALSVSDVGFLEAEIRTAINIRTETVQSLEPMETLKAVCTGKGSVGRSSARNDFVLYRDDDSGAELDVPSLRSRPIGNTRKRTSNGAQKIQLTPQRASSFGPYAVGQLLSLFRIKVPRYEELIQYKVSCGRLAEQDMRYYRMAFVRSLESMTAGPHGEMIPGPEVARFGLKGPGLGTGYQVLDIKSIVRPAHLIPEHSEDEVNEKKKFWIFNNRIDLGTWDMIYGAY